MSRRINLVWWLLGLALAARVVSMIIVPFADTSEPRYAEMARLMAVTGDWITPWFQVNVPFWGKPPLSFWSQALSISLFGESEFAVRLPSLLATLATLWLIFSAARLSFDRTIARWSVVIYSTCALVYTVAGAVLTDPFLVLATTWVMTGLLVENAARFWFWRYGVFLGLAIGLLAKGPLVLVLVGGSCAPGLLFPEFRQRLRALPWLRGTLLTALLVLPWYIAAELKTPGFLRYFLVGEHILRFIDPGWSGDLYGSAHRRPHGTIWLLALLATFPWSLIAIGLFVTRLFRPDWKPALLQSGGDFRTVFLLGWMLFTPLFFTLAGNILWTYVLPAIPAFSILLGQGLARRKPQLQWLGAAAPVAVLVASVYVALHPQLLSSEKTFIQYVQQQTTTAPLLYLDTTPFSARYYSREQVASIDTTQFSQWLNQQNDPAYVAIPRHNKGAIALMQQAGYKAVLNNKHYQLYWTAPEQVVTETRIHAANLDNKGS